MIKNLAEFLIHGRSRHVSIETCRSLCSKIDVNHLAKSDIVQLADTLGDVYRKIGYLDQLWNSQVQRTVSQDQFLENLELNDLIFLYKGAVYINDQSLSDKAIDKLCVKLKNKEPIEISSYMSTKLLDSLCQNAYKRKEIIDFIENMIKQSAFVYGKLDSRFISTLINTYAQLRIDSELVADLISNQILPVKYSLYPDSHKIPIAYSLTCFDAINVNLWKNTLFPSIFKIDLAHTETSQLWELNRTFTNLEILHPYLEVFDLPEYKHMKSITQPAWQLHLSKKLRRDYRNLYGFETLYLKSKFHKEVFEVFKDLRLKVVPEYQMPGPYPFEVDLFYQPDIVIEIQGPSHYIRPTYGLTGKTVLKNKMLTQLGFKVINVPYYKWDKMNSKERNQFIYSSIKLLKS